METKKLTREQVIRLGFCAVIFAAGFYCGCKYMNIDRAFAAFIKRPDVKVVYF